MYYVLYCILLYYVFYLYYVLSCPGGIGFSLVLRASASEFHEILEIVGDQERDGLMSEIFIVCTLVYCCVLECFLDISMSYSPPLLAL